MLSESKGPFPKVMEPARKTDFIQHKLNVHKTVSLGFEFADWNFHKTDSDPEFCSYGSFQLFS